MQHEWNVKCQNEEQIRKFIKKLKLTNKDVISLRIGKTTELFDTNNSNIPIFCKNYDIDYKSSFRIKSNEGIELLFILNGKIFANAFYNEMVSFARDIQYEFVYDICNELMFYKRPILLRRIVEKTNKKEYEIDLNDIAADLCDPFHEYEEFKNITQVKEDFLLPIVKGIHINYRPISKILGLLNYYSETTNWDIYAIEPSEIDVEYLKSYREIKGIISSVPINNTNLEVISSKLRILE